MSYGIKLGGTRQLKKVAKPSVSGTYTYNTATQSAVISGYDNSAMTMSGTTEAVNAGTYSVTFTLKKGYKWSDGDKTTTYSRTWVINKRVVSIPYLTNKTPSCTGSAVSPTINNMNGYITQSGEISSNVLGNHTIYWNLANTASCVWTDGTTSQKSETWTVQAGTIYYTIRAIHESYVSKTTRSCLYGQKFGDICPVALKDGNTRSGSSSKIQRMTLNRIECVTTSASYGIWLYTDNIDWTASGRTGQYRRSDLTANTVITNNAVYDWYPDVSYYPSFSD